MVGSKDIALFTNTTNPPLTPLATSPLAEKANYYDLEAAFNRRSRSGIYRRRRYLLQASREPHRRGPVRTPHHHFDAVQLPLRQAIRRGIHRQLHERAFLGVSGTLAAQSAKVARTSNRRSSTLRRRMLGYIANNYIHLDHEQQKSASGGVSYLWRDTRFSADFLVGSGLRASLPLPAGETTPYGGTSIPNGTSLPYYPPGQCRDDAYLSPDSRRRHAHRRVSTSSISSTRNIKSASGTGVGVGAPQHGPRRGVFFGLSKSLRIRRLVYFRTPRRPALAERHALPCAAHQVDSGGRPPLGLWVALLYPYPGRVSPKINHGPYNPAKRPKLISRSRKLRGQVEAVERALEAKAECAEVMRLLAACRGAVNSLRSPKSSRIISANIWPYPVREPAVPVPRQPMI